MELEYRKCGDYYIPNLVAPENMKNFKIGKYGNLRLRYLKEHKKGEYTILLIDNKLQKHLMDIDKTANKRFDLLMKQFIEKDFVKILPGKNIDKYEKVISRINNEKEANTNMDFSEDEMWIDME